MSNFFDEVIDYLGTDGKIRARRYANGGQTWSSWFDAAEEEKNQKLAAIAASAFDDEEQQKIRAQSATREEAIKNGMPEDLGAVNLTPVKQTTTPISDSGVIWGYSASDLDRMKKERDDKLAADIIKAMEGGEYSGTADEYNRAMEGLQTSFTMPTGNPKQTSSAEYDAQALANWNKQYADVAEKIRTGADTGVGVSRQSQTIADYNDIMEKLQTSYKPTSSVYPKDGGNTSDGSFWGYTANDLTYMKLKEAAKRAAQADAPKFTADQINAASVGLQSIAADQSVIWGMTPTQLAEGEKNYQQDMETKRQAAQGHREQVRSEEIQDRKVEQQDIEYPDKTEDFTKQMLLNAAEARVWKCLPIWGQYQFYSKVQGGGDWDYKVNRNKPNWVPNDKKFSAFGIKMTAESLGNFNYGFTGAVTGFSPSILFAGGGYAAIASNTATWEDWKNYFDSDEDHLWIALGILAYSIFDPTYAIGNVPIEAAVKKLHPELWLAMVKSFKQMNGENKQ